MKIEDIDFNCLYKIVKINVKKVTFKKYDIKRLQSLEENNDVDTIILGSIIGEETYEVTSNVSEQLVGRTGEVIKKFGAKIEGKKRKKLVINEIIELFNKEDE
ncbi:hypothetical protein KKF82_05620 [Patescibacteria group bacterium]|nr:hypothetical protein [Patescibacteria group bacterium]